MNKQDVQISEEKRQQFTVIFRPFFPTMVSVVSLGEETSKMMKEENRRKHLEALLKRAKR
jgi:hypothetical protein